MIRTEREYRATLNDLRAAKEASQKFRQQLIAEAYSEDEVAAAMAPVRMSQSDMQQELRVYEETRCGDVPPVSVREVGRLLISLRIAHGLSQQDLAHKLECHWTQVSRDERHDYHGVTQSRLERILAALDEDVLYIRESEYRELCNRAGVTPFEAVRTGSTRTEVNQYERYIPTGVGRK